MRSVLTATLLAGCAALALSTAALAQGASPADTKAKADALEKLTGMQSTGTAEAPEIPQTGRRADALRKTLGKIKLPEGFKIDLYAVVPDARSIAVGPNAGVLFVGTRKSKVYTVTDRDKDRVADEVRAFAPGIAFKIPNGVCFSKGRGAHDRRAESRSVLPGRRVLLREPGCGGRHPGQAGRPHPGGRGELQSHRPDVPGRAGRQDLHFAGPALQRATCDQARALCPDRHRWDHPHGCGRQEPGGLRHRHPQFGRHGLQPRRQGPVVHRQPGGRDGRRHAPPEN